MSLMDKSGNLPILIEATKIIVTEKFGKEQAIGLHKATHSTIPQMERTLSLLVWPTKENDIKEVWGSCDPCVQEQPSQHEGKNRMDKIPLTTLDIIHIDLLQFTCQYYLSCRDHLSTYTCMAHLPRPDSQNVLQ